MASRQLTIFNFELPLAFAPDELVRTVVSPGVWAMIAGVCAGGLGLQLPLAWWGRGDPTKRRPGRLLRDLGWVISKCNPLWDFAVEGPLGDYRPRRCVVISNHVSNSDAFLIAYLPWEMKWLGKESLFRVPVFGTLMTLAGDVPVVRGSKASVVAAMETCRRYLEMDMPIMIFPEGTRSKTGELLAFKDGAFRLALDTGADILPIAVAGTREALPKHSWRFGFARGRVAVGEPISTEGLTGADLRRLKEQSRRAVAELAARLQTSEAP